MKNLLLMNGKDRKDMRPGIKVDIVLKQDQRSGKLTRGIIKDVLTKSSYHPQGIKVRLETGEVGRVREIVDEDRAGFRFGHGTQPARSVKCPDRVYLGGMDSISFSLSKDGGRGLVACVGSIYEAI